MHSKSQFPQTVTQKPSLEDKLLGKKGQGYLTNSIALVRKYPKPTDSLKEDMLWWMFFSAETDKKMYKYNIRVHY